MRIEYDQTKNAVNIAKHGVGFEESARVFLDPERFERVDDRQDYGEQRFICLGAIPADSICERIYCIAYTLRGKNRRIISARKANEREQHAYYRRFE